MEDEDYFSKVSLYKLISLPALSFWRKTYSSFPDLAQKYLSKQTSYLAPRQTQSKTLPALVDAQLS